MPILPRMNQKRLSAFWDKVEIIPGGCWEWRGCIALGYGKQSIYGKGKASEMAHRISYAIHKGEPGDLDVCHTCDNPCCVRPSHLFLGTHKENMEDAKRKGRLKSAAKGKFGEQNNSARLTEFQVLAIKRALMTRDVSDIAREYSVSRKTITNIRNGKNWSHAKPQ